MGSETDQPPESPDDGDPDEEGGNRQRPVPWLPNGPVSRRGVGLIALVGLALTVAVAAGLGIGPAGDRTAIGVGGGDAPATTATPTPTDESPEVTLRVRSVETCGMRCRSVTIALSNRGETAERDVRVATRITTGGTLIWQDRTEIGRLAANETVVRTRTVRIGFFDAARITANDGRIWIETTVRTANGTRVFTEQRTVT